MTDRTLWHFTCSHMLDAIREDGVIIPPALNPRRTKPVIVAAQGAVVWATDLRRPIAHALGLANLSGRVKCDRTEHRFRVLDPEPFVQWIRLPRVDRRAFGPIEWSDGAMPAHWYVADAPVAVEYDPLPRR